jgi:hypothetical protein
MKPFKVPPEEIDPKARSIPDLLRFRSWGLEIDGDQRVLCEVEICLY